MVWRTFINNLQNDDKARFSSHRRLLLGQESWRALASTQSAQRSHTPSPITAGNLAKPRFADDVEEGEKGEGRRKPGENQIQQRACSERMKIKVEYEYQET